MERQTVVRLARVAAQPAVKVLIAGQIPGPTEWAALTADVLAIVNETEDPTAATLERIESKLDEIADQRFNHAIGSARHLMAEAQPAHRTASDRSELLREARHVLSQGVAAAEGDRIRKSVALWHLGVAYFLSQMLEDARRAITEANHELLAELAWCAIDISRPGRELILDLVEQQGAQLGRLKSGALRRTVMRDEPLTPRGYPFIFDFLDEFRSGMVLRARTAEEVKAQVEAFQPLLGISADEQMIAALTDVMPGTAAEDASVVVTVGLGAEPVALPDGPVVGIGSSVIVPDSRDWASVGLFIGPRGSELALVVGVMDGNEPEIWAHRPGGAPSLGETSPAQLRSALDSDDATRLPPGWSYNPDGQDLEVADGPEDVGRVEVEWHAPANHVGVLIGPYMLRRPIRASA